METIVNVVSIVNCLSSILNNVLVWMIVAGVEFLVIIGLLLGAKSKKRNEELLRIKKKVLNESEVDFKNIVESPFKAGELYKVLIRKCHPDRFAGDELKIAIATELSAKITENKNNFKMLKELEAEAEEKLNVKIK